MVGAGLLTLVAFRVLTAQQRPQVEVSSAGGSTAPGISAATLALVINGADPLSESIGRHYIRARRLHPRQVIRVSFKPTSSLNRHRFADLLRQIQRQTPRDTQAYALAWTQPWRVECVSITSAIAFGGLRSSCHNTCATTPLNPYYARGDVRRPWQQLGLRPAMLLAATSVAEGQALTNRGVAADGTAPDGTAYLLVGRDRRRNVRAPLYEGLSDSLDQGFRVRVLWADALRQAPDVMLLSIGAASVPDITSNRYRPGAIADHLTSFGGVLTGRSPQMSALRWLQAGATGSYGTVVEPCNHPSKFPNPGLALAFYRRGDTLIESYWRSVAMPDQGVFIGEPLARPWGNRRNM